MSTAKVMERESGVLSTDCGMPLDARHFDESGIFPAPAVGREVVLASFQLQPQYCGVLENFSQYTDVFAKDNSQVPTPGLQWLILVNERPLYPYLNIEWSLNPWGYGSFSFRVRLDEAASVQFVVRRVPLPAGTTTNVPQVAQVGGRIAGRYWYNPAYGDVGRRGY